MKLRSIHSRIWLDVYIYLQLIYFHCSNTSLLQFLSIPHVVLVPLSHWPPPGFDVGTIGYIKQTTGAVYKPHVYKNRNILRFLCKWNSHHSCFPTWLISIYLESVKSYFLVPYSLSCRQWRLSLALLLNILNVLRVLRLLCFSYVVSAIMQIFLDYFLLYIRHNNSFMQNTKSYFSCSSNLWGKWSSFMCEDKSRLENRSWESVLALLNPVNFPAIGFLILVSILKLFNIIIPKKLQRLGKPTSPSSKLNTALNFRTELKHRCQTSKATIVKNVLLSDLNIYSELNRNV